MHLSATTMENRKQKVVLFPFMAQGHIIPFLALADHLIHLNHYTVTLVSTPLNVTKLQQRYSSTAIEFVRIPFTSSDHGLPPDSDNTNALPYHLTFRLVEAAPSLKHPFRKLLLDIIDSHDGQKPLCVISDFLLPWVADVAHEFEIFHAIFNPAGGFGMACFYSLWVHSPHKDTNNNVEFSLPDFPQAGKIHATQLGFSLKLAADDIKIALFMGELLLKWSSADAVLFNTVEEMDEPGLSYFRCKLKVPIWAIGPVISPQRNAAAIKHDECIQWLNKRPPKSVLYISFGSQFSISASQMVKLAKALNASCASFLWVIRPPFDHHPDMDNAAAENWLPEGFPDPERGLVVTKWVPQVDILAHRSVAAFLTHCGWNSVLESIKNGLSLICWPIEADQFYNAKMLVEQLGVSVEVGRGNTVEVPEEAIKEKIQLVMANNGKGEELRKRAGEIKELLRDAVRDEVDFKGSSVKSLQEFLAAAESKKLVIDGDVAFTRSCTDD